MSILKNQKKGSNKETNSNQRYDGKRGYLSNNNNSSTNTKS